MARECVSSAKLAAMIVVSPGFVCPCFPVAKYRPNQPLIVHVRLVAQWLPSQPFPQARAVAYLFAELPTCLPIRLRHINGASRSACVCARAHSGFPASPSPGRTWCPPSTSPPAWSSATASPSNAAGDFHRPRPPTSSPCPALPSILSPEMSPSGHSVSSVIVKHGSGEERLSKSPPPCLFVLRLIRETDLQLRLVVEKRFRASGAERPDSDHGLPDGPPVPYRRPAPPQPVPLHAGEPLPPRGAHGDP